MPLITSPKTVYFPFREAIFQHNEKLRASAVRVLGTGHETMPRTWKVVEFGFDLVARVTRAVFGLVFLVFGMRIAALNHKARNDAVKDRLVVKPTW